ncbi:MAG: glutaredoxin family protein [Acidimicrobiia bacterium]|nr:glutaredoxin family protein [Acidimicrobiia bacterium]
MSDLLFLTRATCSLCHEALPWVTAVAQRRDHTVESIDVDAAGLADRFGDRVPVVLRDGIEVLAGRFDRREVRRALR